MHKSGGQRNDKCILNWVEMEQVFPLYIIMFVVTNSLQTQ